MFVNEKNIICAEKVDSLKTYLADFGSCSLNIDDVMLPVYHKRQIKTMHRKEVGQKMIVYALHERKSFVEEKFDVVAFGEAFGLFHAFNEETGELYHFLYQKSEKELEKFNKHLLHFGVSGKCSFEYGIAKVTGIEHRSGAGSVDSDFSYLFGLSLLYGTWQIKGDVFHGVKIQVPLFGSHLTLQNEFDDILAELLEEGIYIERDILETNNGIIYQITISDWEILSCFANWYKDLATFGKISTRDLTDYHLSVLREYVSVHGTEEFTLKLNAGVLKLLKRR